MNTPQEKALRDCVEYCRQQNGRPDCKNCGLDDEMITELISKVEARAREECPKIYCEICGFRPVLVEAPRADTTGKKVYGDIMCKNCHLVIGTISYDMTKEQAEALTTKK